MFKSRKNLATPIIMLIAGAIAGLFLLLKPGATLRSVIRIASWALIISGAVCAVQMYLQGKRKASDYLYAGIQILAGILLMTITRFVLKLIPAAVGLILIALGGYKLYTAYLMKGTGKISRNALIICAFAVVSIIIGIYVLSNPSSFTNTLIRILGAYLLVECAEDLYAYYVSK